MTEKEEKHNDRSRYPSLVWPIILITAGVLFLLSNIGVLDVNFWNLWRLWPVLLILAGIEIILGRRSALGNILVLVITLAVVGGVVFLLLTAPEALGTSSSGGIEYIEEPLDGIERADLKIDFAAGRLDISKLTDSSSLIKGELDLSTSRKPIWDIERSSGRASMTLEYRGRSEFNTWGKSDEWNLSLSPKVGFSLDVSMGAGDARLDLTGLDIRELSVSTGAGKSAITLPDEGDFSAHISGGVGQLIVEIPEDMAARVQVDRGIGGLSISSRFEKEDGVYLTDDWDTNENRVDLDVEVGVGEVVVRGP